MSEQQTLLDQLLKLLDDMQAIDIKIIDVRKQTSVTDYMIICSGRSSRHVKAIADDVIEKMKSKKMTLLSQHGVETGEWALIDYGDFVLHIMQPNIRAFYNLEGLWQNDTNQ